MSNNKLNNKMFIFTLKYLPIVLTMGVFVSIILNNLGILNIIVNSVSGGSLIVNVNLYFGSKVFKFYKWHRILIYYTSIYYSVLLFNFYIYDIGAFTDHVNTTLIISTLIYIIAYFNRNKK